jgi:hypothetical protein
MEQIAMPDTETFSDETSEDREIRFVTARLIDELDGPDRQQEIEPAVESEFRRFDNARVREFVPVLVERRVRSNFRKLPAA